MVSEILQLINDEIICHKKAIEEVDEKLNFLTFLNGFDDSMGRSLNLNKNELIIKREKLEKQLKHLVDKKSRLGGKDKAAELITNKASTSNQRAFLMSNYLTMQNFENLEIETNYNGF